MRVVDSLCWNISKHLAVAKGYCLLIGQESKEKQNAKEYDRLYRARNKDKLQESKRRYQMQNKDKLRDYHVRNLEEYDRQYRILHKDKIKQYDRLYRLRNQEMKLDYKIRNQNVLGESTRLYYNRNKDRIADSIRENYLRNHDHPDLYLPRNNDSKSWKSSETVREYFDSISARLQVNNYSDWYRISISQIREFGGGSLFTKFESLGAALQYAYPEVTWDLSRFSFKGKKSVQRWLRVNIEELLPGVQLIENYLHPELHWDRFERQVELDVWIPQYKIGIEYHGEQHYYSLDGAFGPSGASKLYIDRDMRKNALCQQQGVTLISIPFWWDGERANLSATLYNARPDVFPATAALPIPIELPMHFNETRWIPRPQSRVTAE